ncbi:unnamed protein product [Phytophthora lilii]|uniref:Unnamed protein product n=1 Tax=Phytophthora lilii TaxID=2077276 RepID=A0A9W6WVV4_9STRA|nr:unnamed protein product [Phytophthora lilii]
MAQKTKADELSRLHVALEQVTRFQTLFGAEMDGESAGEQVISLRKREDRLMRRLSSKKRSVNQRTEKVVHRLPRLMAKATRVVSERRQLITEQEELPAKHQWVPKVLWKLYEDVAEGAVKEKEMRPLKSAMHDLMKTLKETNPFFYLQVLYQPPPAHRDGQLEVVASDKLMAIAKTMTPFFRDLKRRSFALKFNRNSFVRIHHGWNKLRFTLAFVRRAARHFHVLILHLYAVAMGCDAPNVSAGIISEKAASGLLSDGAELRARLQLSRASATSEDNLVKETYEWTPELLIYLDEWRRYQSQHKVVFGFDRRERERDFLPQFSSDRITKKHGRRIPRRDVLADIGYHLGDIGDAWHASRLGRTCFRSMRIEDIGALEVRIKNNLAAVVDLVYKMMLARWMERKKRSAAWWSTLELREETYPENEDDLLFGAEEVESAEAYGEDGNSNIDHVDDLQDATDSESVEHKDIRRTKLQLPAGGGFRGPTALKLCDIIADATIVKRADNNGPTVGVAPHPLAADHTVRLLDIYAWADEEINGFQRKTERIVAVRDAMKTLRDRLQWSKASIEAAPETDTMPSFGKPICDDWRVSCVARHLCSLMSKAVAFAEETAMHEAANALTKKPSLRVTPNKTVLNDDKEATPTSLMDSDSSTKELLESVHDAYQHVTGLLDLYDGLRSSDWYDMIRSTSRLTAQLLRTISEDDALCFVPVVTEIDGEQLVSSG